MVSWGGKKALHSIVTGTLLFSINSYAGFNFKDSTIDSKIDIDLKRYIEKKRQIIVNHKSKKKNDFPRFYGKSLYRLLNLTKEEKGYIDDDKLVDLFITIPFKRVKREIRNSSLYIESDKNGKQVVYDEDKRKLTDNDLKRLDRDIIEESVNYTSKKRSNIISALKKFQQNNLSFLSKGDMDIALKDGKNTFQIRLKKGKIKKFIEQNKDRLLYIDIPEMVSPKVASAMISTNVDPYAIDYGSTGEGIGIYIAEVNCPNTNHITNYTRLSGNCTSSNESRSCQHGRNVVSIARAVSPDSHIYCRSVSDLNHITPSNSQRSDILIESYSIGQANDDIDTIYRISDRNLDNEAYDHNIAVLVAAGNHDEGSDNSWNVSSPAKGFNTITIGNYFDANDQINLDDHLGSAHIDPETGIAKPEVSFPGTFITAGGVSMTGTSQAAPHASGYVADLMDKFSWMRHRPYLVKSLLLATTTKSISGDDSTTYGVGNRTGLGGPNYFRAINNWRNKTWSGSYSYHASHDGGSNDNFIEYKVWLNPGVDVKAVICWLNDGDYTYDNSDEDHPIGKDMDLYVYDPDGNMIKHSWSWDNSFEHVRFNVSKGGYYKFLIDMFTNRDTNAPTNLSLSITY